MEACCDPTPQSSIEYSDPTLSSCCQRQAEEERKIARIIGKLRDADRIEERIRQQQSVLASKPIPLGEDSEFETESDDGKDSIEEEDAVLAELRRVRLQQLSRRPGLACQLRTVPEDSALDHLIQSDGVSVLHLAIPDLEVCQEANELLDVSSNHHAEANFWQTSLSKQSCIPPAIGLPHAPALIVFKDGAIICKALLANFCSEDSLQDEKVTKWLRAWLGKDNKGRDAEGSTDDEHDDWQEPCEVCGRRYFHEHIQARAVYSLDHPDHDDD